MWRGNGQRSSFSELLSAAAEADVVMLGEDHHDAVTHKLQEILFARLAASRPATLSLEMFETDVQHVIDEYLGGLLREQDLMIDLNLSPDLNPDPALNSNPDPAPHRRTPAHPMTKHHDPASKVTNDQPPNSPAP